MCLLKQLPCCVKVYPCALSGSSLSSDIATQVTGIVSEQCPSKFTSFGSCHLFPPFWRSCLSFPTHSFPLVSFPFLLTGVCERTSVPRTSVRSSFSHKFDSQPFQNHVPSFKGPNTRLFHNVFGQTHSLEARPWGRVSPQIPHFQKNKKNALACKGFQLMVSLRTSHMAANVGPKAQ